jgi:hypothetical protein
MSDKKIKVPDGMLKAAQEADSGDDRVFLEAALRWLSERLDQLEKVRPNWNRSEADGWNLAMNNVRDLLLVPEPEIPEEVKDLLWDLSHSGWQATGEKHNTEIIEAFNRGRRLEERGQ